MNGSPCLLVIFGITGDLAQRKLLPSLYSVLQDGLLPSNTKIIGVTRQDTAPQKVLEGIKQHIDDGSSEFDEGVFEKMVGMTELYQMSLTEDADYVALLGYLQGIEQTYTQPATRVYYLSIPPQVFLPVVRRLGEAGHNQTSKNEASVRLLVEKPFGYDLDSARELISEMGQYFAEDQIYRIDHYLAKETAQNLLTFRFGNPLFEALWDGNHIESVEIIASESRGIEGRVAFYEQTGALRDIIQSHLLQLLALVTMERPATFSSDDIHQAKLALLQAIEPIAPDKVATETVRGQYASYRSEVDNPETWTETFAAMRLRIDCDRWRDVPMLIRTGKQLTAKATEISIVFKALHAGESSNVLKFYVQPGEGIGLQLQAKRPGFDNTMSPVDMGFRYTSSFSERQPDAYERVLVDALRGDRTLFATSDEVIRSWQIVEHVTNEWSKNDSGLVIYDAKNWGPLEADDLASAIGVGWHNPAV